MRDSITEDLLITRFDNLAPVIAKKIDELKSGTMKTLGSHPLGGFASVLVALSLFGVLTVYADYQKKGGLEGVLGGMRQPIQDPAPPGDSIEAAQR
jgi:hypothetical protein